VGPQRAALRFVHDLAADGVLPTITRIEAELYGGLAFNGREHGSDKAIVAGLGGLIPERCDRAALAQHLSHVEAERRLLVGGKHRIRFEPAQDVRLVVDRSLAFDGNAVRFLARNTRGDILASRVYFSIGNGAVLAEEDAGKAPPCRGSRIPARPPMSCLRRAGRTPSGFPNWCAPMNARCSARAKCGRVCCSSRSRCAARSNAG
jgi:hypothetical protein